MSRLALALTLALAALAATAASAPAASFFFQTPSRNIRCGTFDRSFLRCDMTKLGNARKPRPSSCEFDYGNSFGITRRGSRGKILCVSDAVAAPDSPVLGYGRTWRHNGFTCVSQASGLRCVNGRGHGFALRLGLQRLF